MLNNGNTPFSDSVNDDNIGDTFGSGQVTFSWQLFDYSTTDKHKTNLIRVGSASGRVFAYAQRWAQTTAINSVSIRTNQTFSVGTTFSLYGRIA
jgi:hypothetical protein